jgi:hypothetical protein
MRFNQHLHTVTRALAAGVIASAVLGSGSSAHDRTTQVTWTADVAPILQTRCVGCHDTGGFAPIPLASYQDARAAARQIKQEVLEGRMPPWPAARGFGDFSNDRSLTPLEAELLTAWAEGNTPIGPPVDAKYAATAPAAARAADLELMVPAPHDVTALSAHFDLPAVSGGDRWIGGWEFRPGNRSIITQAIVSIDGTRLGAWTPPDGAVTFPNGVARRLPAGARIGLEVRYRKSASPQTDRSGVAFYFADRPSRELQHRSLPCGRTVLDRDIDALAIAPRVASGGEWIEVVAERPDRSLKALSVVRRYEPAYPITYRFAHATPLARGTSIAVTSSSADCDADLEYSVRR